MGKSFGKGIYLRGKIFWYASKMTDGKRRLVSLQTGDEQEAIQRAAIMKRDDTFKIASSRNTLSEQATKYLESKKQTGEHYARTSEWSKGALKQFAAHVHDKSAKNITANDVRSFYGALRKRKKPDGTLLSDNSARAYLRAVRGFFTWTVSTAKLRFDNPCKEVKLGKATQAARVHFATKQQRDALIDNASDDMKFVLYCAFHAGMRFNEIVEARPEWFNLEDGYVTIQQTTTFTPKNKKTRTVPLSAPFKAFLEEYGLRSPYVLHPEVTHGAWRYRWDFSRPWENLLKATTTKLNKLAKKQRQPANHDLSWITPHVGRHTFASLLVQNNVSMYKVAEWLGDTLPVAQQHYGHLAKSDDAISALV